MKNLKIVWATILAAALIATLTTCESESARKAEEKSKMVPKIDNVNFEDVFDSIEDFTYPDDLSPKTRKKL